MMGYLLLLLVALPIAEIYVLMKAGGAFGTLPVIAAVVATAVIGGILIRWQGLQALKNLQQSTAEGQAPVAAVVDGVFLIIAAPLLMTPGFITDALGFFLLVPFIRHEVARHFLRIIQKSVQEGKTTINFHRF